MTSQKQIEANRGNDFKSTGPAGNKSNEICLASPLPETNYQSRCLILPLPLSLLSLLIPKLPNKAIYQRDTQGGILIPNYLWKSFVGVRIG